MKALIYGVVYAILHLVVPLSILILVSLYSMVAITISYKVSLYDKTLGIVVPVFFGALIAYFVYDISDYVIFLNNKITSIL